MTWPDAAYVQYDHDGLGRPAAVTANAADWTRSSGYSSDGDLTAELVGPTPNTSNFANTVLGRDGIGRLASIGRTIAGGGSLGNAIGFGYNNASQIVSESRSNDSYAVARTAVTRAYTTNGLNQYSAISSQAYCHDANGNLTADDQFVYLYDVENRLVEKRTKVNSTCSSLSYADQPAAILRYDPMGRLYETSVDGGAATITRFLIDGDAMVAEYNSTGAMQRRYVHGVMAGSDDPIAWYEGSAMNSSTLRYLHANQQGSITLTGDSAGLPIRTLTYDEYGVAKAADAALLTPASGARFLYTGQMLVPELGLYYYKARMREYGNVSIAQEAFIAALRMGEE